MLDPKVSAIDRAWRAWRVSEPWHASESWRALGSWQGLGSWLSLAGCQPRALADKGLEISELTGVFSGSGKVDVWLVSVESIIMISVSETGAEERTRRGVVV